MWKEKSFAFAFWVVFVFGNIFLGFLVRFYGIIYFWIQDNIPLIIINLPGPITLHGYTLLIYMVFSIIYLYRKSSLLDVKYNKMMCFFLGFYLSLSSITMLFTGHFSFFHLVGRALYDVMIDSEIEYISIMIKNGFDYLKSAAEIASCKNNNNF